MHKFKNAPKILVVTGTWTTKMIGHLIQLSHLKVALCLKNTSDILLPEAKFSEAATRSLDFCGGKVELFMKPIN